jgi:hypothetical protein
MNTYTQADVTAAAQDLFDQKAGSVAVIKAHLTIAGYSAKTINAAIKELGIVTKKASFATDFYEWLAIEARETEEVTAFINGTDGFTETSENVKKHLSHYTNIADLARKIWEA